MIFSHLLRDDRNAGEGQIYCNQAESMQFNQAGLGRRGLHPIAVSGPQHMRTPEFYTFKERIIIIIMLYVIGRK